MSGKHAHAHCAHTHISYCAVCQVVYCHDCSQEWTQKPAWTWAWPNTYGYGGTLLGQTTTGQYPQGTVLCNEKPHTHGG